MLTKDEIHTLIRVASQYGCLEYDFNILIEEKDDGFVMQLIERYESEPDSDNYIWFIKVSDKYDGLVMLRHDLPDGQKTDWIHVSPIPSVLFAILYA